MLKSLEYISNAVGGRMSVCTNSSRIVNGFFSDSRTPQNDKLFLAIRGERVDGNSFVQDLISKGCAVMTDREENLSLNGDVIFVSDVREALQLLAKYYRETELSEIPFVGITGSVGKTTTKDMVALAVSSCMTVHKTVGNSNSQIGLPQTVLAVDPHIECAVVELGMSMPGEMERISRCAMPNVSVITNIGYSHIENLGSREAIRDEKLKICDFSKPNSCLILNGDEPLLHNIDPADKKLIYVSVEDKDCHCFAKDICETPFGISFTASVFGYETNVSLNVKGMHFVINSLFALAVCHVLGLDIDVSAKALTGYQSDGKRQHIYEKDGHIIISDCYNASPESMKAALSVLSGAKGRRIAVLGDMLELGTESITLHKLVGEYTNNNVDVLITYGDFASVVSESSSVSEKYEFSKDQREVLKEFLTDFITNDDTVLYKGSNGMKLGELIV